MLTAELVKQLGEVAADVVATDGGFAASVEMGECVDGSHRSYALITMNDDAAVYRVTSPAPWNSPAWASTHRIWTVEVQCGERGWEFLPLYEGMEDR